MTTTQQTYLPRHHAAVAAHDANLHAGRTVQQQTAGDCPKCMADEAAAYRARVERAHGGTR